LQIRTFPSEIFAITRAFSRTGRDARALVPILFME
jgi:hypothetical protein